MKLSFSRISFNLIYDLISTMWFEQMRSSTVLVVKEQHERFVGRGISVQE